MRHIFAATPRLLFLISVIIVYGGHFTSLAEANRDLHNEINYVETFNATDALSVKIKNVEDELVSMYMHSELTVIFELYVLCSHEINAHVVHIYSAKISNVLSLRKPRTVTIFCRRNVSSYGDYSPHANKAEKESDDMILMPEVGLDQRNISGNGYFVQKVVNVTLRSGVIGTSSVSFEILNINSTLSPLMLNTIYSVDVVVLRAVGIIDTVFVVCVYALEILEMLTFGTQLDLKTVKRTLKKPQAPLIGFLCQYLGMPLISYGIAKVIASDSLAAFGIFVAGICPGGGSSNIYAFLLDGDLSLSITMTTISTVMSLAMMPLWLYTVGSEFLTEYHIQIPFVDILLTLLVILLPLTAGLLIKRKLPNIAKMVQKVLPFVVTILALCLIVTGIYSSLYIFRLFDIKIIIIGCCLPYIGFVLGGMVALICRQPWGNIKTIVLETGMQNTGIGFILLLTSFPAPLGDIATVAPISSEVMSPIPPFVISIIYLIVQKCCKKYVPVEQGDNPDKCDELFQDLEKHKNNIVKETVICSDGFQINRE